MSAQFKVGDIVIYINSNEKGVVTEVCPPARGRQLYKVSIDNIIRNCLESNLMADIDLSDPFKRLEQSVFGSYLDFSRLNTSFKIKNTSTNTISSLKASNTIFKAYQFKPLLKFLNSDNRRILVADEVGLGKTIEAGHIMLELKARGELRNAVIISPKSLQEKWQTELKLKFNLDFKIYDNSKDFLSDLKDRPSTLRAIINYEKIRPKKVSKSKNENEKKVEKVTMQSLIQENNIHFDFVLCDEAHRLRNSTTQLYKGASTLIAHSKSVVFLTATPIMISEQNLFNLLSLLDPVKYNEYSTFRNQITVNRPFIQALSLLNRNASFQDIISLLTDSEVRIHYSYGEEFQVNYDRKLLISELFADIPLFKKIISDLELKPDNPETRVQLQYDLSDMSELNKIFSRTRKVDVTQDWSQAVREPKTILIELEQEEQEFFDEVIDDYIDKNTFINYDGNTVYSTGVSLGLVQKKRQISSSVYAYLNSDESLDNGIDEYDEYDDAKLIQLQKVIEEVCYRNGKKLIVFAIFKKTLKYLKIRLSKAGLGSIVIHGDIQDRYNEIQKFKNDPTISVLLSSEVGSEGLDMQFCDALVNYDLPWNPMVVEQRIGRIDRFGQQSSVVNIYNFVVKNSIQEEIYTRLLDRIGIFRGAIGDLEAILDKELDETWNTKSRNLRAYFSSLEKELYCTKISKEVREKKFEKIQRAILIEKRNLEEISQGLTDTLTNDIYFKNEILSIEKTRRYVTELELVHYLRMLFETHLTTCEFTPLDTARMLYEIKVPKSSPKIIINFLNLNRPEDDSEVLGLFHNFISQIMDESCIRITFSQEEGYRDENLIRINAYHPLIVAAQSHFTRTEKRHENTFKFGLRRDEVSSEIQMIQTLVLAQYKSTIIKNLLGREQRMELLTSLLYDVEKQEVISNKDLSDEIYANVQINAGASSTSVQFTSDEIQELSYSLTEEISHIESVLLEDYKMRLETSKKMQTQRVSEYFDNRIKNQELILNNSLWKLERLENGNERTNIKRILPIQKNQLKNLREEKLEAVNKINQGFIISKSPELLSLSLITVS
jgi:SNF2 family DNA or RNA helicase